MIKSFINLVVSIFRSDQGIKQVYLGETKIYERPGAYFYLTIKHE